jgi:hypothetical protein
MKFPAMGSKRKNPHEAGLFFVVEDGLAMSVILRTGIALLLRS